MDQEVGTLRKTLLLVTVEKWIEKKLLCLLDLCNVKYVFNHKMNQSAVNVLDYSVVGSKYYKLYLHQIS